MMTPNRTWARAAGIGAALFGSLVTSSALADQIVVLDETWVHTPDLSDSHYRVAPAAGTPASWVSPVDYSKGTAWVYLEVHTKPTDQPTRFQVCFEATPTYACTAQSPTYTTTGVYEWQTSFADFWSPPGESVDWTQGVNKIACILKDTMNNKPSADNVGADTAALYTPTEVRLVVTLVEPGGTYVPPTATGTGGSGGGGGATGGSGAGGATGSSGGAGGAGPGGTGASNAAGGAAGGSGGATGGAGAGGATGNDNGCACALASRSSEVPSAWWLLAGVAAAMRRRRKGAGRAGTGIA